MILKNLVFNMAYGKYKELHLKLQLKITITNNPKCDGYQKGLASMIFKFFDKKSKGSGIKSMSNQQLANKLHKPIIRKF